MAAFERRQEAFDFSLDAQDFRQKLHRRLMEAASAAIELVDDNDLEWVSAAGNPHQMPDDQNPCGGGLPQRME